MSRWSNLEIDGVNADADAIRSAVPTAPAIKPVLPARPAPTALPAIERAPEERVRASNLTAVEGALESTGTLTYWSLSGAADLSKLTAAWEAEGLNITLPAVPTEAVALHRAVKEQATARRLLRKHPEGGWTLVQEMTCTDENGGAKTLDYAVGPRFRLVGDAQKGFELRYTPAGGKLATEEQLREGAELAAQVRAAYDRIRNEIAAVDVSAWLVWAVSRLDATALRTSGGFYFVPRKNAETLAKIARALTAATGHTVYEIPVMQGSKTVAAVLDGLRHEVNETIRLIEAEAQNEMGARAARNRQGEIDALKKKVQSYELLLRAPLPGALDALDALHKALGTVTTRAAQLEVD